MKKIFLINLFCFFIFDLSFSQCSNPSAASELNINNVRATLLNGGDFWWNGSSSAGYEFPKVNPPATPIHALFSGAIWLSAIDNGGNLQTSAMTYRGAGFDFYPGPINSVTDTVTNSSCSTFDRFWEITKDEIQVHLDSVSNGVPIPVSNIDNSILEWPAKGNSHFTAYNIIDNLAPFIDLNNNGIYDPENGDYPDIKGDQAIFWVVNDIGGPHGRTGGNPIGVEVQFMAYAYNDISSSLYNTTFYDINVVKKTVGSAFEFYFGLFVDPDLGDFNDDYVGCNIITNSGFVYNGTAIDGQYGSNPPIISTTFLNKTMTSFNYFSNGPGPQSDPDLAPEFRNYMTGKWKDGTPITDGGTGYGGSTPTNYVYYDNPALNAPAWSERSNGNASGDRRYLQCSGPITLNENDIYDISFATIAHQTTAYNGAPNISSFVIPAISETKQVYTDSLSNGNSYNFTSPIFCNLTFDATVLSDTSNLGVGSIEIDNINGGIEPYGVDWSNNETTNVITDLTSGDYTVTITDSIGCTIDSTFMLENFTPTNIKTLDGQIIKVYPNPVSDVFTIQFGSTKCNKIKLIDMTGKSIVEIENIKRENEIQIDMTNYNQGIYLLSIETRDKTYNTKLIK